MTQLLPYLPPATIAVAALGIPFMKAAFGVGSGPVFTSLVALALGPVQGTAALAPMMFLTDAAALRPHWRRWDWVTARILLPGALIGVGLGTAYLRWAPVAWLNRILGAVALLWALSQLVQAGRQARLAPGHNPLLAWVTGVAGGAVSTVAHSGGIIFSFYLVPRLAKEVFVPSLLFVLLLLDTVKLLVFLQLGLLSGRLLIQVLATLPLMWAGGWLGGHLNRLIPARWFLASVAVLVAATGVTLIFR